MPAQAQIQCGARESILTQLYLSHQEQPVAVGLSDSGNILEVLASEDGTTWTIMTTGPSGVTCIVQTGERWQPVARRVPSEGS